MTDARTGPWILWSCAALVIVTGCAGAVLEPSYDESRQAYTVQARVDDLVQTIEFSQARPAPGDTLRIESVVVNHGEARDVEARICGLDLETDLELTDPFARCAGYSTSGQLASGDSLRSSDAGVIESGAGTYRVRVRHLLDPERWVAVEIEVARP